MGETEWTRKVCKHLENVTSIIITSLSASVLSKHGIPDRHFHSQIWRGWVEFKGVETPLKKTQQRFLKYQNKMTPYSGFIWRQKYRDGRHLVILQSWDEEVLLVGTPMECLYRMEDLYREAKYGI